MYNINNNNERYFTVLIIVFSGNFNNLFGVGQQFLEARKNKNKNFYMRQRIAGNFQMMTFRD